MSPLLFSRDLYSRDPYPPLFNLSASFEEEGSVTPHGHPYRGMYPIERDRTACIFLMSVASGYNSTEEGDDGSAVCSDRKYLDRCLSKLPRTVDESLLRRMPVSESEIEALCRGFQIGMQCINKYSSKCLVPSKRQFLEKQISGARKLFHSLCDDESFRSEYLQHTTCLRGTQKNWESCARQFTQIVKEEMDKNLSHEARLFQTCCAFHGFSRCVYVPGRLKCQKDAALFLLKIAEMSIGQQEYLRECNSIVSHKACSACGRRASASGALLLLLPLVILRRGGCC